MIKTFVDYVAEAEKALEVERIRGEIRQAVIEAGLSIEGLTKTESHPYLKMPDTQGGHVRTTELQDLKIFDQLSEIERKAIEIARLDDCALFYAHEDDDDDYCHDITLCVRVGKEGQCINYPLQSFYYKG